MTQIIAYALIETGSGSWEEDFKVSSKENAEKEIKEVVQTFNDTLKPGEKERSFEKIVRFEEKEIEEKDEDDHDEWEMYREEDDDDY